MSVVAEEHGGRSEPLPCAHGGPAGNGQLRATLEDFVVREWLGFEADGEGEHWLLYVRKQDANTHWVAGQLARLAQVHPREVGYAGLKDRAAIAEQSFTVPVRCAVEHWPGVTGNGFEVVRAARHRRKLKRGSLRGNDFEITVRNFDGDPQLLQQRLDAIGAHGVPNYFGPQRFGRNGGNLQAAAAMFSQGAHQHDRHMRGFALSAARAEIFNSILAARVAAGTWNVLQAGDIANLDGSGSIFPVAEIDDALRARCRELDIHPTAPMWGAGELRSTGAIAELETSVASRHAAFCDGLAQAGLQQERRALRLRVHDLAASIADTGVRLRFRLRRGAFATAVLHELVANAHAQMPVEEEG